MRLIGEKQFGNVVGGSELGRNLRYHEICMEGLRNAAKVSKFVLWAKYKAADC
jgi:hypothetical protein